MGRLVLLSAALMAGAGACGPPEAPLTPAQVQAEMVYDLGPEAVDVHFYPADQQENYQVFRERCSHCHTAARPLNYPAFKREEWERFVGEMHLKSGRVLVTDVIRKQVVDFLVFDAEQRKRTSRFERKQEELRRLYERVLEARKGEAR